MDDNHLDICKIMYVCMKFLLDRVVTFTIFRHLKEWKCKNGVYVCWVRYIYKIKENKAWFRSYEC